MIDNVGIRPKLALMVLIPLLAAIVLGGLIWRAAAGEIAAATEDKRIAQSASVVGTLPLQMVAEINFQDLRTNNPEKARLAGQVLVQGMNGFVDASIARYRESPAAEVLPPALARAISNEIDANPRIRAQAEARTLSLDEVRVIQERRRQIRADAQAWISRQVVDDPSGSWRALVVTSPTTGILVEGATVAFRGMAAGTLAPEDATFVRDSITRYDALYNLEQSLVSGGIDIDGIDEEKTRENINAIAEGALVLEGVSPPRPAGLLELAGYYELGLPVLQSWAGREDALARDIAENAQARIDSARQRQLIILGGVALTLLIALAIAGLLARNIVGRLGAVSAQASRLNSGIIGRERKAVDGGDEIGVLGTAIDGVSDIFLRLIGQTEALAAGRLDDEALREPLPGALGSALQGSVDRVARSSAELMKLATHDELTGLLDRAGLNRGLDALAASRGDGSAAAFFIDLDDFKDANDALGHAAGDRALIETARRLTEIARTDDLVARYGGDEFVVVAPHISDPEIAADIGNRMAAALSEPMIFEEGSAMISASIGWAMAEPGTPLHRAIELADEAMYAAKRDGGGDVVASRGSGEDEPVYID